MSNDPLVDTSMGYERWNVGTVVVPQDGGDQFIVVEDLGGSGSVIVRSRLTGEMIGVNPFDYFAIAPDVETLDALFPLIRIV